MAKRTRKLLSLLLTCTMVVGMLGTAVSAADGGAPEPVCGLTEHTHTADCYTAQLICGQEESAGHVHSDACCDENGNLICGLEESSGHAHDDTCYSQDLTCEIPEHTHSSACYAAPEHEHVWDDGTVTTPASCTEEGVMTYTCTDEACGETKTEPIPAAGHSYVDGVCEVCGAAESSAEDNEGNAPDVPEEDVPVYVAQIGDQLYETLDDAIAEAEDGVTIELLGDANLTKTLDKSMTINGNGHTVTSQNVRYGFSNDRKLIFQNITLDFNYDIEVENPSFSSDLALFYVNGDTDFTFENSTIYMDGSGASNRLHGIYYDSCSGTVTLENSTLEITNFPEDAIEWGGQSDSYLNIRNSNYTSDRNRSGFTGTFQATISNSNVDVLNSTGNGSNGTHFEITDNSVVNFLDNTSHGLSAGILKIDHSTVTATGNGGNGIHTNNDLYITNHSIVTVENNDCSISSQWTIPGAIHIQDQSGNSVIDGTSHVTIKNNSGSGILLKQGTLTVQDGADITITNNEAQKLGYGGGINNRGTLVLPSAAILYNNHAATAGDDIYNTEAASITFGPVGSNWALDGEPDCTDDIDGWYDDSTNARWKAHGNRPYHVDEVQSGTITGLAALKAAHDLIPLDPADPELPDWTVSKSKTATNLDSNYESEVTLSLPAADYQPEIDVVFVIDDTHAGKDIFSESVNRLLEELDSKDNLNIKLGIVTFDAVARDWLSVTSDGQYSGLVSIKDTQAREAIEFAVQQQLSYDGTGQMRKVGGTNLEWPIEMAHEMLSQGTGSEQYLVLFSDLYGYIYRGDITIDGVTYEDLPLSKRIGTWDQGSMSMGILYSSFDEAYQGYLNGDGLKTPDGFFRDSSWGSYWSNYYNGTAPTTKPTDLQVDQYPKPFSGFEQSTGLTYDRIMDAAQDAQVIIINNDFTPGDAPTAQTIKNEMLENLSNAGIAVYRYETPAADSALSADQLEDAFINLKNELIQLVDANSTVEDYMGYVPGEDGYNFDFVNEASELHMVVGGVSYEAVEIGDNQYGFVPDNTLAGGYRYVLEYVADDLREGEHFVWTTYVPVTKDAPVQLVYTVRLTNPQTSNGTYGIYDADGSQQEDGLYTNNRATLYPVDSNGEKGIPENFAKPTVSYTVDNGGGGSSRDYYDVTVNYYDQDGNTIRSSYTTGDIREGRSWDVTDRQLDTITYNGVTYTFDRAEGDPLSGTNIREDKVVDLYYTAEGEDIPDPEVPEGALPTDPTDPGTTDPTDPTDPTQPGGGTDLEDPDVPTAEVPETGDASLIWAAAALLSGIGLAWLVISGKKREENA